MELKHFTVLSGHTPAGWEFLGINSLRLDTNRGGPAFSFQVKGWKVFKHAVPDYFLRSSMPVDA